MPTVWAAPDILGCAAAEALAVPADPVAGTGRVQMDRCVFGDAFINEGNQRRRAGALHDFGSDFICRATLGADHGGLVDWSKSNFDLLQLATIGVAKDPALCSEKDPPAHYDLASARPFSLLRGSCTGTAA